MKQRTICMLTTHHSPLDSRIFYKEALSLKAHGYSLIVITASEDQNTVFQGIAIQGFRVNRILRALSRILLLDWISIFRLAWVAVRMDCEVYHAHEFDSLISAWMCRAYKRRIGNLVKMVYDVHEWYPEFSDYGLRNSFRFKVFRTLDRFLARRADLIIATEHEKAQRYETYRDKKDVLVLGHYPRLNGVSLDNPFETRQKRPWVVGYVGDLTMDRGDLTVLEGVRRVQERTGSRIDVIYVGDFSVPEHRKVVMEYARRNGISLEITGRVLHEHVSQQIARMDICLAILHPKPYLVHAVPIKLFEYMVCGKPILASNLGNIRRILDESGAGITVNPSDTDALAEGLLRLLEDPDLRRTMGQAGLRYIQNDHHWAVLEKKLLTAYADMCGGPNDRGPRWLEEDR